MSEANNAAMCGSKKDAKNPVGACPVKFGVIDIIPVRYAIDDMDNEEKEQKHPLLDTHKGHGFFDVAHSKYTLRQLRDGWLYVYSNKDKTFHEYQVKGTQFIKIDWGSNEADKAPEERGQAGEAKSCLSYSKNDTLTISFSHQRWTWRLCEHMRSNTQCRNEWMRTVDLKTYSNTLEIEHGGGMRDFVHAVADIGTPKPSDVLFEKTCSPLKDDDPSDDEFHLATHKKTVLETDYQCDLLEKNSALYIALDDQLADITDLFLKLSSEMAEKAAIMGDEDKQYKLQMAELTRTLGRVRLDENELPKEIRKDPISIFQFEKELTDYLYIQGLANEEQALPAAESVHYEPVYTPQAKAKLQELKNTYSYKPDSKLLKKFKEATAYTSDVNWEGLDEFVISHYSQLKGTSERINNYLSDFIAAVTQLGIDPLILGLDNQYENHQAYLLNLVSQFLIVVKQVPELEEQMKELDELLSFDSPNNLLALAPVGFSFDNWEALNDHINEGGKPLIDPFSAGDMDAFWSRFSEWDSFTGDARIQEKAWFQSLVLPIQKSFAALEGAVKNQVDTSWRATMDLLFPSQWKKGASSINVVSNLRLIFLESMMTDSAIVEVNKSYKTQRATFLNKLNVHIEELKKATKTVPGQRASKNHQVKSTQAIQQRIQTILSSEMPAVLALKNSAVNAQAKQLVNNYVDTVWTQTKEVIEKNGKGLGKLGGVLAALNIWELAVVTKDVNYKAEQAGDTFYEQFKPVWREVAHASAYVVANISTLFRDKAWGEIKGNKRLLELSLKDVSLGHKSVEKSTVNIFAKHALITASFGLIATGLEAWESFDQIKDENKRVDERFGYWLKFGALTGQFTVFLAQGSLALLSRLGISGISSILAPWMLSTLMVSGVLYLIAIMIINIFTRTELQNWLYESCWGKGDLQWGNIEAISRLESILHKPQLSLKKIIGRNPTHSQDPGSMQWQLIVDLPSFTKNKQIGLKIKRIPYAPTFQYGFKQPEKLKPILVDEQGGQWVRTVNNSPRYIVTVGGTVKDGVEIELKMPFQWLNSDIDNKRYYLAQGNREGDLIIRTLNDKTIREKSMNQVLVVRDNNNEQ
ncbi:membrane protein [Aliivibrio wodanis]|uniref:Membrane protein n=1 Tax=Aliivibrio wodanis TaxID=80852 RepID=A0A090IQ83_9GAMM|nr:membrane protein [Aliivibrio wodanis]